MVFASGIWAPSAQYMLLLGTNIPCLVPPETYTQSHSSVCIHRDTIASLTAACFIVYSLLVDNISYTKAAPKHINIPDASAVGHSRLAVSFMSLADTVKWPCVL